MNIKKGDILKWKGIEVDEPETPLESKVLEIIGDLYFMSFGTTTTCNRGGNFYTPEGLKENFILPEEKWAPKKQDEYWYISLSDGKYYRDIYENSLEDNKRISHCNVFRTESEAEQALAKIKEILKK